jgi:MFS family permease
VNPFLRLVSAGPVAQTMLMSFFFFGSLNGFVLLPLYVEQLGGSESAIGLVQGLYSAAGIVCQPLVGALIDRLGRRFFMLLGAALLAATCAAFLVTAAIPVFAVLRAVQGVAFSAFFVASYLHVVDLVPPAQRGWALGIFGLAGLLSTSLAPLLGEAVVRHLGFRPHFAVSLLLAAASLALVARLRHVRPRIAGPAPGLESVLRGLAEAWRLHMAVMLFFGVGSGAIFTFLPTFAERLGVRGLGLFYTAYAGAAMAVRVAGGRLIDTRGRRAVIVPSMLVQATATAVLALVGAVASPAGAVPVLPFLFLAGILAGGAHGFLYPALSALLMDLTPEARRARAIGTFSSVFLVGNAIGAMLMGLIAHALGYRAMWGVVSAILLAGFLLSRGLRDAPGGPDPRPAC